MPEFSMGDYISIGIMALMAVRVAIHGFTYELSSKAGIILGLLVSLMFSSKFTLFIDSRFGLGRYSLLVALILLFLGGYISAKFLLSSLNEIFELLHLRFLDHILGFGLGAIEGALIVSAAVYVLRLQDVFDLEQILTISSIVERLTPLAPFGIDTIIQEIQIK